MAGYLFETIAANIEREIGCGALAVGTKLPSERSMAESYGVSRNVIREAIRVLEEKGFVEVRAGRGGFVCKPSQKALADSLTTVVESSSASVEEIVEAREIFESAVLAQAAKCAREEHIEVLRKLFTEMERNKRSGARFAELDKEFHLALARCTGNSVITLLAGSVYSMADSSLFRMTPLNPARMLTAQQEHAEMLEAIAAHDEARAVAALGRHIHCIREQLTCEI